MASTTKDKLAPWDKIKQVDFICDCGTPVKGEYPEIAIVDRCDDCVIAFQGEKENLRIRQQIRESADFCGIPPKYREWSPTVAAETGSDKLLDWLREVGLNSAWIGGTNGIGKTHATLYRAFELLGDGVFSYCVRSSAWLRETVIERTRDGDAKNYKLATSKALLVLDDLGKERLTEPRGELLYDIIDERDRRGLPVWITTNFTGGGLMDRLNCAGDGAHEYGYAIMKRLKRMIPEKRIWK